MKKEELFETLSDLDPVMVKKARDYDMEKWTGEFGSPLPVGAKDGYGSLSGICGADDGCTGIYGK